MNAPQGTWEIRDKPTIGHFLVGQDAGMVTIRFLDFDLASSINLTPDIARKVAASLLKHADAVEGKARS